MMSYQLYCQFCLAPETRPGSDQTPDPGYTCDRCAYAYEAGRIDEANAQAGKRAAERIGNDDTVSPRAEATDAGVQDAALLEAGGEALPPVVHEALEGVRDRSRDAGDALERLAAQLVERRDGKAAATIADLRDRLRVLEPMRREPPETAIGWSTGAVIPRDPCAHLCRYCGGGLQHHGLCLELDPQSPATRAELEELRREILTTLSDALERIHIPVPGSSGWAEVPLGLRELAEELRRRIERLETKE